MRERKWFKADNVFLSTRGLHFEFSTPESAYSFYSHCLSEGRQLCLEGSMAIDPQIKINSSEQPEHCSLH